MPMKKLLKAAQDFQARQMSRLEEPRPQGNHDESNWLVSYADMMTLLCGFFIMLFSFAKLDPPQYEKVKESVSQHFKGEYKSPAKELAKSMEQVLKSAGLEKAATVQVDGSSVTVAFESTLFFDTLSAEVKPEGKAVLDKLASQLAQEEQKTHKPHPIVVEGHTDSRPILGGMFPSNWELSGARAARVVRVFLDKGFAPDKLTAIGYADTRPQAVPRTADGAYDDKALSRNRRVVLRIMDPGADAIPFAKAAQPAAPKNGAKPAASSTASQVPAPASGSSPLLQMEIAAEALFEPRQQTQAQAQPPKPSPDRVPAADSP